MTYQHLTAEIDRCKATAQAFLNYKRGDCTFDDFVMFAMENNNANPKYARISLNRFVIERWRVATVLLMD
jgi:hypothetical protein